VAEPVLAEKRIVALEIETVAAVGVRATPLRAHKVLQDR
jgi:hypothetical protein